MSKFYAINVKDHPDKECFESFMTLLTPKRQKRIRAFLRFEDSVRSLVPEVFLRLYIRKELGLENGAVRFSANEYGKPFLEGYPDFHYNISHSGDWVALGLDDHPLGVDVEKIKPMDMDIAKRFFSPGEYADLMALPEEEQLSYFFDLWTLKESYIKALGKGLSHPLADFSMIREEDGFIIETRGDDNFHFLHYPLEEGYRYAVCTRGDVFPRALERLTVGDIFHLFNSSRKLS